MLIHDDSIIIFDDALRPGEAKVCAALLKQLGWKQKVCTAEIYGFAVLAKSFDESSPLGLPDHHFANPTASDSVALKQPASSKSIVASQTRDAQADSEAQRVELKRQETLTIQQQEHLLEMRISEEIDQPTYAKKSTQLRDRLASLKLHLDCVDRSRDELADLASKVFELSQSLKEKWVTADYDEKRRLLEIVF